MQRQNQPTWYKLLTSTIDSLREARPVSDPNNRGEGQVVQLGQRRPRAGLLGQLLRSTRTLKELTVDLKLKIKSQISI